MERCAGCGRELAAEWKFCIYCGRPVGTGTHANAADRHDASGLHAAGRRRRFDVPTVIGIAVGVIGTALVAYAAIQIFTSAG